MNGTGSPLIDTKHGSSFAADYSVKYGYKSLKGGVLSFRILSSKHTFGLGTIIFADLDYQSCHNK
jgi:hypothetical protein